jgi:hypothetical protein
VVFVDDFSSDNSTDHLYTYLEKEGFSLNNKITFVRNNKRMGAMANFYYYVNKFCEGSSIVVNVDADDALIGAQVFNLLNTFYQDPETWFVYGGYI